MTGAASQAEFAAALLDPGCPLPVGLKAHNGSDPVARFAVYRNNVVASLVAALGETFPVVRELVGTEFFEAMARVFIKAHPSRSPMLAEYGADLPGFIAAFAPARSLPYLPDLARLEFARVQAFHAADAPALDMAQVTARLARPEQLPGARWVLHPSLHVITSAHAVASLWAAHQGLLDLEKVDPAQPEAALVLREHDDAAVIALPHAGATFVHALLQGRTLGQAVESAASPAADGHTFDLPATLALLITHGALSAWHFPENTP